MIRKEGIYTVKNERLIGYELLYKKPIDTRADYDICRMILKRVDNCCFYTVNLYPQTLIEYSIYLPENVFVELIEHDVNIEALNRVIEDRGLRVIIDDFGIGASNIDRILKVKNLYCVKVDRIFWREFPSTTREIVRELKRKGIKTLAEKVETSEELTFIKSCGFDFVQGYYFKEDKNGKRQTLSVS